MKKVALISCFLLGLNISSAATLIIENQTPNSKLNIFQMSARYNSGSPKYEYVAPDHYYWTIYPGVPFISTVGNATNQQFPFTNIFPFIGTVSHNGTSAVLPIPNDPNQIYRFENMKFIVEGAYSDGFHVGYDGSGNPNTTYAHTNNYVDNSYGDEYEVNYMIFLSYYFITINNI